MPPKGKKNHVSRKEITSEALLTKLMNSKASSVCVCVSDSICFALNHIANMLKQKSHWSLHPSRGVKYKKKAVHRRFRKHRTRSAADLIKKLLRAAQDVLELRQLQEVLL